ncbi:hypothetical protein V8C26DRAFT_215438 [Trichoderma gracile]
MAEQQTTGRAQRCTMRSPPPLQRSLQAATCSRVAAQCRQIASLHIRTRTRCMPVRIGTQSTYKSGRPAATRRSSWKCRGKHKTLETSRSSRARGAPLFLPPEAPIERPGPAPPQWASWASCKGDTFSVPPAPRQQGWQRPYIARTLCEPTRAPGFPRSRLITKPGACDCSVDCLQPPASSLQPPAACVPSNLSSLGLSLSLSLKPYRISSLPSQSPPGPSSRPFIESLSPSPRFIASVHCPRLVLRHLPPPIPSSCRSLISLLHTGACRSPS